MSVRRVETVEQSIYCPTCKLEQPRYECRSSTVGHSTTLGIRALPCEHPVPCIFWPDSTPEQLQAAGARIWERVAQAREERILKAISPNKERR